MLDSQLNPDYEQRVGEDYPYPDYYEDEEDFRELMKEMIVERFVEDDESGCYDEMTNLDDIMRLMKIKKQWSTAYNKYYDKVYDCIIKGYHEKKLREW